MRIPSFRLLQPLSPMPSPRPALHPPPRRCNRPAARLSCRPPGRRPCRRGVPAPGARAAILGAAARAGPRRLHDDAAEPQPPRPSRAAAGARPRRLRHRRRRPARHRPPALALDRRGLAATCPAGAPTAARRLAGAAARLRPARRPAGPRPARRRRGSTPPTTPRCAAGSSACCSPTASVALDGVGDGMVTGYYEPLIDATRQPRGAFRDAALRAAGRPGAAQALVDAPADRDRCRRRRPRCAAASWPGSPTRSTRWCCTSRARGGCACSTPTAARRLVRAAFAGHNDQPYRVGRPLADRAGRAEGRSRLLAGDQGLGAAQPGARRRAAVGQPALRVLPRGAAARPERSGRAARRACR